MDPTLPLGSICPTPRSFHNRVIGYPQPPFSSLRVGFSLPQLRQDGTEQSLPFSDSESFSSSIMQTTTTDWRKMGHASLILLLLINSLVPFSSGKYKFHFLIWVFQSPIRFAVCSLIIVDFVDDSEPLCLNYAQNIFIHTSPALDENERHHEFLFVISILKAPFFCIDWGYFSLAHANITILLLGEAVFLYRWL